MKRLMVVGAIAAALSGCFEKGPADDALGKSISALGEIEASNNSPDVTVKSWWRVKDATAVVRFELCKNNVKVAAQHYEKLSQLSSGDLLGQGRCGQKPPSFDRQVTKVDVQSETRAVVTTHIKNVTPPEEGAVLDADAKKAKEAGEPFQYVLERNDAKSGWKITKIASFPSYARDWQSAYPKIEPSNNRYVYGVFQ
jgi:hypothetical protein